MAHWRDCGLYAKGAVQQNTFKVGKKNGRLVFYIYNKP